MKLLIPLLAVCFVLKPAHALDAPVLLTFDHVSPVIYVQIKNGYGGLEWKNFFIENATNASAFGPGVVSSPNVAFNGLGDRATIRSSIGLFTLNSAYLTAVYVDTQQIRVRGFRGNVLAYDNTYTVNNRAPTLIDFNYVGVDRVAFTSATEPTGIFAVDDLLISPYSDDDRDGVPNDQDLCPGTIAGAVVNEQGCSIDQMAPCSGPLAGGSWRNHQQYVAAVAATANDFLAAGLMTQQDRDDVVRAAASSDCGKRAEEGRPGRNGNEELLLRIRKSRPAHSVNFR